MFLFFAQWFTDSFLRTSLTDYRKNDSNHEIDLCQIYGLGRRPDATCCARTSGGRLKSQLIDGEEYPGVPVRAAQPGGAAGVQARVRRACTTSLPHRRDPAAARPTTARTPFFAVGLEHGNSTIGNTIMNIVFLREHNRVAGHARGGAPGLGRRAALPDRPQHHDRAAAQAGGRGVHQAHRPVRLRRSRRCRSSPTRSAGTGRTGCAIEFNLLYRWHSLVPDAIGDGAGRARPGRSSATTTRW